MTAGGGGRRARENEYCISDKGKLIVPIFKSLVCPYISHLLIYTMSLRQSNTSCLIIISQVYNTSFEWVAAGGKIRWPRCRPCDVK